MPGTKDIATRAVTGSSLWDPFEEMRGVRRAFAHLFDSVLNGGRLIDTALDYDGGRAPWFPAVNVEVKDKEYLFTADVPGLQKENVNVEVEKGLLKISGERKEQKEEKAKGFIRKEQFFGTFDRGFVLPDDAKTDDVKADYKNGVLSIHVARVEGPKPKSVKVNVQ